MHDVIRLLLEVDFAVWIVSAGELAQDRGEAVGEVEVWFPVLVFRGRSLIWLMLARLWFARYL